MNIKDKILNAKLKSEKIYISQWDAEIEVKELNGGQRAKFFDNTVSVDKYGNVKTHLEKMNTEIIILSCYDPETGERLFKEEDRELILQASGEAIDQIAQVALKISGLSNNAVVEAEKN